MWCPVMISWCLYLQSQSLSLSFFFTFKKEIMTKTKVWIHCMKKKKKRALKQLWGWNNSWMRHLYVFSFGKKKKKSWVNIRQAAHIVRLVVTVATPAVWLPPAEPFSPKRGAAWWGQPGTKTLSSFRHPRDRGVINVRRWGGGVAFEHFLINCLLWTPLCISHTKDSRAHSEMISETTALDSGCCFVFLLSLSGGGRKKWMIDSWVEVGSASFNVFPEQYLLSCLTRWPPPTRCLKSISIFIHSFIYFFAS